MPPAPNLKPTGDGVGTAAAPESAEADEPASDATAVYENDEDDDEGQETGTFPTPELLDPSEIDYSILLDPTIGLASEEYLLPELAEGMEAAAKEYAAARARARERWSKFDSSTESWNPFAAEAARKRAQEIERFRERWKNDPQIVALRNLIFESLCEGDTEHARSQILYLIEQMGIDPQRVNIIVPDSPRDEALWKIWFAREKYVAENAKQVYQFLLAHPPQVSGSPPLTAEDLRTIARAVAEGYVNAVEAQLKKWPGAAPHNGTSLLGMMEVYGHATAKETDELIANDPVCANWCSAIFSEMQAFLRAQSIAVSSGDTYTLCDLIGVRWAQWWYWKGGFQHNFPVIFPRGTETMNGTQSGDPNVYVILDAWASCLPTIADGKKYPVDTFDPNVSSPWIWERLWWENLGRRWEGICIWLWR